ncbi:MAG: Omp28-related outer membrane protein [Saprospiraceae bacterium]|nr:Omp28-related outer membrane protein [Saprospiraceae bacterium]
MWHSKNYITYIILCILIAGCSEPEVIIPPLEVPTSGKHVLVEDLTGVRCPNCPSANARLEAIKSIYGENLIIVGVHGDLLTRPLPESKFDFRNPSSRALEQSLGPILGKPSAVINRKIHPEFSNMANPLQDQWQTIVERELQLPQQIVLQMDVIPIDSDYMLNIGILPMADLGSGYRLHVMVTENNIIDAQEDVDRIIDDYEHNHILRAIVSPFEGILLDRPLQKDDLINTSLNIEGDMIEPFTTIDNMEIIVFITDDEGSVEEVMTVSF